VDIGWLLDHGYCQELADFGDRCFVPAFEVLLSHVLVHGIAQHGLSPTAYPMMRMLADVQDLAIDEAGWSRYLNGAFNWISSDVSRAEVEAVAELACRLGDGEHPRAFAEENSNPARLLRHVIAGVLDDEYQRSLRIRAQADPQREGTWTASTVRNVVKAVVLTDAQIDAIYGRPNSKLGYLARRIFRPLDLAVRAVRYGWSWIRYRVAGRVR
jgi:hypothetical protein